MIARPSPYGDGSTFGHPIARTPAVTYSLLRSVSAVGYDPGCAMRITSSLSDEILRSKISVSPNWFLTKTCPSSIPQASSSSRQVLAEIFRTKNAASLSSLVINDAYSYLELPVTVHAPE